MQLKKLSFTFFIAIMAFSHVAFAQSPLDVGIVKKVTISDQKINLRTQNAFVEVTLYSPSIIRVRMDKKPFVNDPSYAVVAKPLKVAAQVSQNANLITIQTDSTRTVIKKKPFSIAFYTADGRLVNEDETGLSTSWIGDEVTTYKKMQERERFIGLGEKTGNLDRKGTALSNWNTDIPFYQVNQDPLYSTIPFYVGIHHDINYGVFFDNSYQSDFNFGASNNRFSSFSAQGGEMDYYLIYHKRLADIVGSYTWLTGRMPMPPLWSLGYQQNRYSYYPDKEVYRIAHTLREKNIPADGITLDIHYMDAYKLFTWNKERFPDPLKMTSDLSKMGFKTTVILDPGIKVEDGYKAYESGKAKDVFIKYTDQTAYTGKVWPGWCNFPDFTSEKGREWWRSNIKFFTDSGVRGFWNDMNEIATWGNKMPNNVLFDFDGNKTTHKEAHNVYGMQMARSSYEGARMWLNKRPFTLTRAGYAGLQRYTAIWTGDNRSEENHILAGIRIMNSLGVSGVAFTGMDVGGFSGGSSSDGFAKWVQVGSFTPYFRSHSSLDTKASEPWAYGEKTLEIARNYINLRYKLLPYIYSSFFDATQTGQPLMKTLAIEHTFDPNVYKPAYQNQYYFGLSFLIVPFESSKEVGNAYFPKGKFYNLYNDSVQVGAQERAVQLSVDRLPVYVRESSIIPFQSLVQTTAQKPSDTLALHIYKGGLMNSFQYYEDDGESYDYQKQAFYKRVISFNPGQNSITLGSVEGVYNSNFKHIKFVLHGFNGVTEVIIDKKVINLISESWSALSNTELRTAESCAVKTVVINNTNNALEIKYQ